MANETNRDVYRQQFHQQFAENYNSISAYLIAFLVALMAAFIPYYETVSSIIAGDYSSCCYPCGSPCSERVGWLLLFDLFIIYVVLLIIVYLCLKQGLATRRDQFINYKLRRLEWSLSEYNSIFSDSYHPFGKCCSDFLVGTFNYFYWICNLTGMILAVLTGAILWNLGFHENSGCVLKWLWRFGSIPIYIVIVTFLTYNNYSKYKRFEEAFKNINPSLHNK